MRLAHCAQVAPYILTRMLRVTSFDEVLSHVRERVNKSGIFGGLAYWMAVALTRRPRGRPQIIGLGGARRQAEITDQGTADSQWRADGMVRNARPNYCSAPLPPSARPPGSSVMAGEIRGRRAAGWNLGNVTPP